MVESVQFKCDLFLKKTRLNYKQIKNIVKKKKNKQKNLIWSMKNGVSRTGFLYASVFDGEYLYPLKPSENPLKLSAQTIFFKADELLYQ